MSYNVSVHCHTCGNDLTFGHGNMTSNVSGVWMEAGAPLKDWDGKTGVDILAQLQSAITVLSNLMPYEREEYKKLVRGDGSWGTVDSAREFLIVIRDAICRDPQATLSIGH